MKFRATVELGGKTATGIEVPEKIVTELGAGRKPAVKVSVGKHSYRTTVASMGGRFLIPLSAENRAAAGVSAGDEVQVQIELDTEPRVVTVPEDLTAALAGDADAKRAFDKLSYSHQLRHVLAIEAAKGVDTRQRRVSKALEILREGKS